MKVISNSTVFRLFVLSAGQTEHLMRQSAAVLRPKFVDTQFLFFLRGHRSRAGNSLIGFLSEFFRFLQKNERMSDSLKNRAIRSFAHFW